MAVETCNRPQSLEIVQAFCLKLPLIKSEETLKLQGTTFLTAYRPTKLAGAF